MIAEIVIIHILFIFVNIRDLSYHKNSADEQYMDEYDGYNIEQDKLVQGHGGKGRSKKEVEQHHKGDGPAGHTRKNVQKLMNNAAKNKKA